MSLDAKRGLRINGESVKLRGACIHHDSGLLGAATFEDAQYRQVAKLKEAGFNAIRMSHHPMAPAMLRACDELGMYVRTKHLICGIDANPIWIMVCISVSGGKKM